jgi:predicted DCC family thiol-disulfide oxidoreductase YuxK
METTFNPFFETNPSIQGIVFFDDDCMLCSRSVLWLIGQDRNSVLRFSPLKSSIGTALFQSYYQDKPQPDSVVYVNKNGVYSEWKAVIEVLGALKKNTPLFWLAFRVIPYRLGQFIYRTLARYRIVWFGKSKGLCNIPDPCLKNRILYTL